MSLVASAATEWFGHISMKLGGKPRKCDPGQRVHWRASCPWKLRLRFDPLRHIYGHSQRYWSEGYLGWGIVLNADDSLFRAGQQDGAVRILYSTTPRVCCWPELLLVASKQLSALFSKKHPTDEERAWVSESISHEFKPGYTIAPLSCTSNLRMIMTSSMAIRGHLPGGVLGRGLAPILRLHDADTVMIVPGFYWPEGLSSQWRGSAEVAG